MNSSSSISTQELTLANCVSYRLRRAARLAAKIFDATLKPTDLRNTQFTLLSALVNRGAMNIGDLSELLATDGTTLTRNLEVLARRGLIEDGVAADARIRIVQASDRGRAKYEAALPLWRTAQQQVLAGLHQDQWIEMVEVLRQIEAACNQAE